jgi:hypothetical protein
MLPLELSLDRAGTKKLEHDTIDFGEWDVALGGEFFLYIRNNNDYAKAVIEEFKHSDSRVIIDFPKEVMPLTTEEIKISLPAIRFSSEEQERDYFKDVFDQLSGKVKWKRP